VSKDNNRRTNHVEMYENGYGLSINTVASYNEDEYAGLDVAIIRAHNNDWQLSNGRFDVVDCISRANVGTLYELFEEVSDPDYNYCENTCKCKQCLEYVAQRLSEFKPNIDKEMLCR
jgi:hypothetical protein